MLLFVLKFKNIFFFVNFVGNIIFIWRPANVIIDPTPLSLNGTLVNNGLVVKQCKD